MRTKKHDADVSIIEKGPISHRYLNIFPPASQCTPAPALPDDIPGRSLDRMYFAWKGWPRADVPATPRHLMPPRDTNLPCFKSGPGRRHPLVQGSFGFQIEGRCQPNVPAQRVRCAILQAHRRRRTRKEGRHWTPRKRCGGWPCPPAGSTLASTSRLVPGKQAALL